MPVLRLEEFSSIQDMFNAYQEAVENDDEVEIDLGDGELVKLVKSSDGTQMLIAAKSNDPESDLIKNMEKFASEHAPDAQVTFKGPIGPS